MTKSIGDKEYTCITCEYSTSDRGNYHRHTKSKRHLKKVSEINNDKQNTVLKYPKISTNIHKYPKIDKQKSEYVCKFCNLICARANSLNKHLKTCSVSMVEKYKREFDNKLKEAEKEYRLKYEYQEDQIDLLKSDLIYYKNLIKDSGVGNGTKVKITTNVQSLIVSNHENAPALEYSEANILQFDSTDAHENSLFLINRYKDNTFTRFVGKCIVAACKKEDPDEQSVWATDANRLTMFIKKMMDNDSKWISDKKGIQTTKYLINPILKKIKEMLIRYNRHIYSRINKMPQHEVDYYNDIMIHCRELVHFIEHEKLADEILRYMAPRLTYEIK